MYQYLETICFNQCCLVQLIWARSRLRTTNKHRADVHYPETHAQTHLYIVFGNLNN